MPSVTEQLKRKRNYKLSLQRLILLICLLAGAHGAALAQSADQLSKKLLEARIQTIRDSGKDEDINTTLKVYQQALKWLKEADAFALIVVEVTPEHRGVGFLEVVPGELPL